jgi:hypothetical protein
MSQAVFISDSFRLVEFSMYAFSQETTYFKSSQSIVLPTSLANLHIFRNSCFNEIIAKKESKKLFYSRLFYSVTSNGLCFCLKDCQGSSEQPLRYIWEINTLEEMLTSDDETLREWGFKLLKDPSLMERKSV